MGINYNPRIVIDGLQLYLDASNPKSYPGSGSTWYDLTANKNNATIGNGEYVSSGYIRNSSNTSGFLTVSVPDSTSISDTFTANNSGWTIEELFWTNDPITYPECDAGTVISTAAYAVGATGFDWNHGKSNNSFQFGQSNNNSTGVYQDTVTISIPSPYDKLNTWKLRTMIWDRTNNINSLYINGDYIGQGSTPNTSTKSLYDGGGILFGSLYGWKHFGRRALFRIYNRILTATEIKQNFYAVRGRYGL